MLALGYLHEYGVVHRGVRPESVLFSDMGHVRLVGLDYAKRVRSGGRKRQPSRWRRTATDACWKRPHAAPVVPFRQVPDRTFTFCGAPDYVAPEMLTDRGYSTSVR